MVTQYVVKASVKGDCYFRGFLIGWSSLDEAKLMVLPEAIAVRDSFRSIDLPCEVIEAHLTLGNVFNTEKGSSES